MLLAEGWREMDRLERFHQVKPSGLGDRLGMRGEEITRIKDDSQVLFCASGEIEFQLLK